MPTYRHYTSKAVRTVKGNTAEGRAITKDPAWERLDDPAAPTPEVVAPAPTAEPDGREHPGSDK